MSTTKIDLSAPIRTLDGNYGQLGKMLLGFAERGNGENKDALRCMRLADKLEGSDTVELDEKEVALLLGCIEKTPGVIARVYRELMYHIAPEQLAESDRDAVERTARPVNLGNGGTPDIAV